MILATTGYTCAVLDCIIIGWPLLQTMNGHGNDHEINGMALGMFLIVYVLRELHGPFSCEVQSFLNASPVSLGLGSDWDRHIYNGPPALSHAPSWQVD